MSVQFVNAVGEYIGKPAATHQMIDNYVYLYHTNTLIVLPTYPESLADSISTEFNATSILSRSAPIYSYSSSGPRSTEIQIQLHRDMMYQVNTENSRFFKDFQLTNTLNQLDKDYVDLMIKQLQSMALPKYASKQKMVDPPLIAVRFGNAFFCKGIVDGGVTVTYSGPILRDDKYAIADVSFKVTEVDPYDAEYIATYGSLRGVNPTLERHIFSGGN